MTLQQAYQFLVDQLQSIYDKNEAAAITELVLEKLTGLNRKQSADASSQLLDDEAKLKEMTTELLQHRPVQYVLNEAWFYDLKFEVNESVLIPRPETEELVDWVIKDVKSQKLKVKSENNLSALSILDIGTGSGCIPITIKKKLPDADVLAIDVSSEAVQTASENAKLNEVEVRFQTVDFLNEDNWKKLDNYDFIISNPPYIKSSEAETIHKNVLEHEPHTALFVPDEDALLFYRKIADFALQHLNKNGAVYVEINQLLGKETSALFEQKGFAVELRKDMSGNERMIKAVICDRF
ncbi:MAG: peptide chain release factor N(5)-glutamine methyltransferase [Lacibacter sp.]